MENTTLIERGIEPTTPHRKISKKVSCPLSRSNRCRNVRAEFQLTQQVPEDCVHQSCPCDDVKTNEAPNAEVDEWHSPEVTRQTQKSQQGEARSGPGVKPKAVRDGRDDDEHNEVKHEQQWMHNVDAKRI